MSARKVLATWGPVLAALAVLAYVIAKTWAAKDYYSAGTFTYALDDAYIHMALAKNLATHGVFGATPFEFTSASSSPLWTLLLALGFKIAGVRDLLPLILTSVAAAASMVMADHVLRRFKVGPLFRLPALVWLVVATPLVAIVFGGMEHPLQILIDVGFVYVVVRLVHRPDTAWDRLAFGGLALAAAVTAVRYEGAVLIALASALLALRKRWAPAVAIAAAGAAPIVVWGLYSLSQGGFFLPNSVLVKSADSLYQALLNGTYVEAWRAQITTALPVYLALAAAAALLVFRLRQGVSKWHPSVLFSAIAVAVSVIHLFFGQVGWFYRYEDYLLVLLVIGAVAQLAHAVGEREGVLQRTVVALALVSVLFVATAVVGWNRGRVAYDSTPRAMENIYEQMYQTAHFLEANPQYDSVAIGDLGAVAYYNDDLRILDLEGLAETGVPLESLGRKNISAEVIAELAARDGCELAIVYPDYFDLPQDWQPVAYWKISNNLVAYADRVVFLAIPPTDPAELEARVREYTESTLPDTVEAGSVVEQ